MLSSDAVVAAGVQLVRREGVEAVGVRAVAAELGVTPMALYRYVADGDTLRAAVVTSVLAGLPDVPVTGRRADRFRAWATATRTVLAAHPGSARLLLRAWTEHPRALEVVEQLLGAARGLPDPVAASNAVFAYVLMRVEAEEALRTTGGLRRQLRALGAGKDRFPLLWANAAEYSVARVDEHFAFGLDALLAGVARRSRGAA